MASIRDVAKEAGVSPATVSRTFTTPSLINVNTKKRVLAAALSLDYRPPRFRTSRVEAPVLQPQHAGTTMNAVGFQFFSATSVPEDNLASNGFYASVLSGAQAEASLLGLHLLVHTTDRRGLSQEIPRMILEKAIGGLLLVGTADPAILSSFARHVPNIILVDNHDETETHESVVSDGFSGTLLATRYLIELGHQRIGFFLTESGVMSFQDRLRGYHSALFEAGLLPDPKLTFGLGSYDDEAERRKVADLLRSPHRPTAIVCANDDAAVFLMRLCREVGLKVPDDISIIGFDDIAFSEHTDPPLTTVRVDKEFLGRLAVRRLNDGFKESLQLHRSQPPVRHVVPVSLVLRESCRSLNLSTGSP